MHRMISWLENKRIAERKTPHAFAKALGVTPSYYYLLLQDDRVPGNKLREALRQKYPEAPDSLFLPSRVENSDIGVVA